MLHHTFPAASYTISTDTILNTRRFPDRGAAKQPGNLNNMLKRIALIFLLLVSSTAVLAQYDNPRGERSPAGSRNGRFESSALMGFQNGSEKIFEGGAQLDVGNKVGWGFSLGWNWTQNLNVSYRLLFTEPDYVATIVPEDAPGTTETAEHTMSKYSHQLNLTYHFRDGGFTPLIYGGVGIARVDSNVPTGVLEGACWWDPWWGYICYTDWETYTATELTYNIGLGFRWDINNALFSRATYGMEFVNLKNGYMNFGTGTLEVGLMF